MDLLVIHKNCFDCFASAGEDALFVFGNEFVIVGYWRIVGMTGNGEVGSIPESQAVSASIFHF